MFQKEMALRLVAKSATKDYGLLTLWALIYTEAKILFDLPPTVFRPRPKVISSFVHFRLRTQPLLTQSEAILFWPIVKTLFQHRRKTMGSVLKKYFSVAPDQIKYFDPQARAEDLDFEALKNLALQVGTVLLSQ